MLAQKRIVIPLIVCTPCVFVLWQHFLGFAFFPFAIRRVRGYPTAEGSLPRYCGTATVRRVVSVSSEFRESVRQGVTEPLQKRYLRFSPLHPSH